MNFGGFALGVFTLLNSLIGISHLQSSDELGKAWALSQLGEYDGAIEIFSEIIKERTEKSTDDILTLYNQRGDLFFAQKRYAEALNDYQRVLSYINTSSLKDASNRLRSICGCLFCYEFLNESAMAETTFAYLVNEVAFMGSEINDVEWLRESVVYKYYVANIQGKRKKCTCEKDAKKVHNQTMDAPPMTAEESCILQCNAYAVAVTFACSRVPIPAVQFLCVGCVFGLEQACVRCCKGDGFWENCVKPLRRLFHDPDHPENPAPHPFE